MNMTSFRNLLTKKDNLRHIVPEQKDSLLLNHPNTLVTPSNDYRVCFSCWGRMRMSSMCFAKTLTGSDTIQMELFRKLYWITSSMIWCHVTRVQDSQLSWRKLSRKKLRFQIRQSNCWKDSWTDSFDRSLNKVKQNDIWSISSSLNMIASTLII